MDTQSNTRRIIDSLCNVLFTVILFPFHLGSFMRIYRNFNSSSRYFTIYNFDSQGDSFDPTKILRYVHWMHEGIFDLHFFFTYFLQSFASSLEYLYQLLTQIRRPHNLNSGLEMSYETFKTIHMS